MIKAVTTSLIASLMLATVSTLPAQSETATAVNEAVRRQADRITLRQKLSTADAAERRRELGTAATLYDECWTLIEGIGSGIEQETRQTVAGLTRVRMQLARDAQARSDFREADRNVTDALRVNPQDQVAQQFKARNDSFLAQQKRFSPSPEALAQVPVVQKEKEDANILVQDAKLLFELGKYDEADVKLQDAKKLDPGNVGANYYLSLVQQARFRRGANNRDVAQTTRIVQVEEHWADDSVKRLSLPSPNPYAKTNLVYTSPARQAIMSKLDAIHLESINYESLPLTEVVRDLSEKAKRRDPDKKGINFLINPQQSAAASVATTPVVTGGGPGGGAFNPYGAAAPIPAAPAAPLTDPTTGLPIPSGSQTAEQVDIKSIAINISPALSDIRLADALDAIVTVADKPIKYSILDYAVVFSLKGPELAPLTSRRFKVDPNTFYQGLENVSGLDFTSLTSGSTGGGGGGGGGGGRGGGGGGGGQNGQGGGGAIVPRVSVVGNIQTGGGGGGGGGINGGGGGGGGGGISGVTTTNSMAAVQAAVITFFRAEGVNLDPPKSVFFNDREGTLWVRATTEDLDIIEQAIQVLNIAPPQVNIRVKFVEVTQNDTKALGFDWYLGNVLLGGGKVAASGGTQPTMTGRSTAANPLGTFPGGAYVDDPNFGGTIYDTRAPIAASDGALSSGLRNMVNAPAIGSITGILTDPQFKMVLRALQQRNGVDELTDGNVTTLSGRQTQFQAVDLKYIVTSQNASQTSAGGGGNAAAGGVSNGGGGNGAVASQIVPQTSVIPLGPTIDVIPYVGADGYTIQMSLIPTLIEFLGYDDPGQFIVQSQSVGGAGAGTPLTAILPLPHFRLRQVTTSCIVWDGQTIVLGGLISDNVIKVKDQIPLLGDLPWVGRLFRSEQNQSTKGNLLIFVTPTIIDPAGNRVHTDEDLPFAQNTIPSQPKP